MKKTLLLISLLCLSGCETINSATAPKKLKEAVAMQSAVAQSMNSRVHIDNTVLIDPTPEQLLQYLQQNEDAWTELNKYYGGE